VPSYGILQSNAKNQFNEHICANSIACNASINYWCYPVLLLFGDEKTKYGGKPISFILKELPFICHQTEETQLV
jgi:hypothetical protein